MNVQRQELYIIHITPRSHWEQEKDAVVYRGDTLESEGFIHCSKPGQTTTVANAHFSGRTDLILALIRASSVVSPIIYEGNSTEMYPHIYGPLNRDAVIAVYDFLPDQHGNFQLPAEVLAYIKMQ